VFVRVCEREKEKEGVWRTVWAVVRIVPEVFVSENMRVWDLCDVGMMCVRGCR